MSRLISPLSAVEAFTQFGSTNDVIFTADVFGEKKNLARHINCGAVMLIRGFKQPENKKEVLKIRLWCDGCKLEIPYSVESWETQRRPRKRRAVL